MRCRRLQPYLLAWLEGDLPPQQRHQVEAHVAGCPACAAALQNMQQTLHLVRAMEVPEPEAAYWETFMPLLSQRMRQEEAASRRRRPLLPRLWQALPHPALAALVVGMLLVSAMPLLRTVWEPPARPVLVLSGGREEAMAADLDFLKHLDLLEEVDVMEDADIVP